MKDKQVDEMPTIPQHSEGPPSLRLNVGLPKSVPFSGKVQLTTPDASLAATTGSIRSSVARSAVSCRMHGGGGAGAAASERSSTGEEEDGDMALSTTAAEGNAVRRYGEGKSMATVKEKCTKY